LRTDFRGQAFNYEHDSRTWQVGQDCVIEFWVDFVLNAIYLHKVQFASVYYLLQFRLYFRLERNIGSTSSHMLLENWSNYIDSLPSIEKVDEVRRQIIDNHTYILSWTLFQYNFKNIIVWILMEFRNIVVDEFLETFKWFVIMNIFLVYHQNMFLQIHNFTFGKQFR